MKNYLVISFYETTTALYMERVCKEDGKEGRMISLPRQISAGCGLAWATVLNDKSSWEKYLQEKNIECEAMTEVMM